MKISDHHVVNLFFIVRISCDRMFKACSRVNGSWFSRYYQRRYTIICNLIVLVIFHLFRCWLIFGTSAPVNVLLDRYSFYPLSQEEITEKDHRCLILLGNVKGQLNAAVTLFRVAGCHYYPGSISGSAIK